MLKFIILGLAVAGAGALGYFGERFVRPTGATLVENAPAAKKPELLFELPLGKFTMQIIQNKQILHLLFDINVYIMGSAEFQKMNGAVGQARLRDAMVTAIAELAETDLDLANTIMDEKAKTALSEKIVRKLYVNFPMIRTARIKSFIANTSARQ
ncbi:MAG: hypothetical protein ACJAVM_002642 [Sulfitobacter sp.]|jgi:hypothetical protein